MVVLSIEQKVGSHNRDANRHNHQDDENQKHKAINIVNLVIPERRENEVHFDENGAKGKQATQGGDYPGRKVPD